MVDLHVQETIQGIVPNLLTVPKVLLASATADSGLVLAVIIILVLATIGKCLEQFKKTGRLPSLAVALVAAVLATFLVVVGLGSV